jgi:hypothetical protein
LPSEPTPQATDYRRLTGLTLATAAIVIFGFFAVLLGFRGHGRIDEAIVQAMAEIKQAAVDRTAGSKMLIVSGSSGLYGIRAATLSQRLGMPVINMGLHGGLGTRYLGYFGEKGARPGDIVLWAIEYPLLTSGETVTENAVFLSWARGDDYFRTLALPERLQYFRGLSLDYLCTLVANALYPPPTPVRLALVNELGDFDAGIADVETAARRHANMEITRRQFAAEGVPFSLDPDAPNVRAVLEGVAALEARGVRVLATWPNVSGDPVYQEAYRDIRAQLPPLYEAAGAEFIEPADGALLAEADLADTAYHPNGAAAERRTRSLADAICTETDICR